MGAPGAHELIYAGTSGALLLDVSASDWGTFVLGDCLVCFGTSFGFFGVATIVAPIPSFWKLLVTSSRGTFLDLHNINTSLRVLQCYWFYKALRKCASNQTGGNLAILIAFAALTVIQLSVVQLLTLIWPPNAPSRPHNCIRRIQCCNRQLLRGVDNLAVTEWVSAFMSIYFIKWLHNRINFACWFTSHQS